MEIKLHEDYKITADDKQYMLKERKVVLEGDRKGEEYWVCEGYFPKLEGLLTYYIDLRVRKSDVSTLKELVESVKSLKAEVREILQ